MGYNAKQFAEHANLKSPRKIKKWFDAGYLGNATRNECGIYNIPFDTPVPFSANPRVKKNSSLWEQFLKAADNNQAVFKTMFPLINEQNFNHQLDMLVNEDFIEIINVNSSLRYLSLRPNGLALFQHLNYEGRRTKILSKVNTIISTSTNIITIIQALASLGICIANNIH